jgi:hypothetical protein
VHVGAHRPHERVHPLDQVEPVRYRVAVR